MNEKKKGILSMCALLSVSLVATMIASSKNVTFTIAEDSLDTWYHYGGVEATCENYGLKEYWTNCSGQTVTEKPAAGNFAELDSSKVNVSSIVSNPEDARVIKPLGHNFDGVTGDCVHDIVTKTTSVISTFSSASLGIQTLEETADEAPAGFDKVYNLKRTYSDGVTGYSIANYFTDYDLSDVSEVKFYIDGNGKQVLFAKDNNAYENCFCLHPSASGCDKGTVVATQTAAGSWIVKATDFKFYDLNNNVGSTTDTITLTNRTTLNELFARPNVTWNASAIKISEVQITKASKCGAHSLNTFVFQDMSKFDVTDEVYQNGKFGRIYKFPNISGSKVTALEYGDSRSWSKAYSLEGINKVQFYIENRSSSSSNTFYIVKNGYGIRAGQKGLVTLERDATVSTTWNASLTDTTNLFVDVAGGWANVSTLTLTNVEDSLGLLNVFSYSEDVVISDIVTYDALPEKLVDITNQVLDLTNNTYVAGSTEIYGYGNLGTLTAKSGNIKSMFTNYSLADAQEIKFYVGVPSSELVFDGPNGWSDDTKSECWALHPSDGANKAGILRLVKTAENTWEVQTFWNQLRNCSTGTKSRAVTFTGSTLGELLKTSRTWGAASIPLSHIYLVK